MGVFFSYDEAEGEALKTVNICYGISEDFPSSDAEELYSDGENLLSGEFGESFSGDEARECAILKNQ